MDDARPLVARWAVAGMLGGLAAGVVLAVPAGGEELVTPLALPVAGAAGGGLLGAAVGLAGRQARRVRRPAARERGTRRDDVARPAPEVPPEPVSGSLPAPPGDAAGPAPEGWYADPLDDREQRWWDGQAWTSHVWRPRRRD